MTQKTSEVNRKDKWIPRYFILFFLGLMVIDGFFVYLAVSTHTGVVDEHAYEDGLRYNEVIEAAEEQEKLGVKGQIVFKQPEVIFRLVDESQHGIADAKVTAHFTRLVQEGNDFSLPLVARGDGVFSQKAVFPLKGSWNIRIVAKWNDKHYQVSRQIVVR